MIVDLLNLAEEGEPLLSEGDRQRRQWSNRKGDSVIVDGIKEGRIKIRFVTIATRGLGADICISLPLHEARELGGDWGVAGVVDRGGNRRTVWVPRTPRRVGRRDDVGRMKILPAAPGRWSRDAAGGLWMALEPSQTTLSWTLSLVVLDDPVGVQLDELDRLGREAWPRLKKSDWFFADSPAQVWDALIDGSVYDPRPSLVGGRHFRCQQCANAWWSYLYLASREGSSELMRLLATEVAWSVRAQQEEPGDWRHGFWHEDAETHLRFFNDGIGMLLAEAEDGVDGSWVGAAEKASDRLVAEFSDRLPDGGVWFLHDSVEAAGKPPPRRPPDLGQSPSNTLCLNTHVQALTVLKRLHRLQEEPASDRTERIYQRGLKALQRVLELDSAPSVYRVLGACVRPAVESKGRAGWKARITRVLAFRAFPRLYWWIRRRFPRLVYPNGFIERDMASSMLADDYHVLNVKDLLALYALDPHPWLKNVLDRAFSFLLSLDLEKGRERSPLFLEASDVFAMYCEVSDTRSIMDRISFEQYSARLGSESLDRRVHELGLWKDRSSGN